MSADLAGMQECGLRLAPVDRAENLESKLHTAGAL